MITLRLEFKDKTEIALLLKVYRAGILPTLRQYPNPTNVTRVYGLERRIEDQVDKLPSPRIRP
jgi:hypothetical protein